MQVHAVSVGQVEYRLRQDQAVSNNHHQIRFEFSEFPLCICILQAERLKYRNRVLQGELFDWPRDKLAAAAGRAVRLAVDPDYGMLAIQQRLKDGDGEIRGTRKNNTHRHPEARSDNRLSVFLMGQVTTPMAALFFQFLTDTLPFQL